MIELYDLAKSQVTAIIEDFRGHIPTAGSLHDKLYNASLASLRALRRIHAVVHAIPGASVAERRAAVLEAFDRFYREVIGPLDLPGVPEYLERSIVDPALGSTLHAVAAALVDFVALSEPAE